MSNQQGLSKAAATFWASIVAQAWEDDKFKNELISNTAKVLENLGYGDFLDSNGKKVKIVVKESTSGVPCDYDDKKNILTLYLPARPDCLKTLEFNGQFMAGYFS